MTKLKNEKISPKNHVSGMKGVILQYRAIFSKTFKDIARNKANYFWAFGYPLLFMAIFAAVFANAGTFTARTAIINEDGTVWENQSANDIISVYGEAFVSIFNDSDSEIQNTFIPYFDLTEDEAYDLFDKKEMDVIIVIPSNFSESIIFNQSVKIQIFTISDPFVQDIVSDVVSSILENLVSPSNNRIQPKIGQFVEVTRMIDYMMPALVIGGVTVSIMNAAELISKEREKRLLIRIDTTPVSRGIQLFGNASAQLILTTLQSIILLGAMVAFGTKVHPDANWFLALIIVILAAISCIGIGFILGTFLKNSKTAGLMSWVVILPLQFLGGIFGLPSSGITKFMPTIYPVRAIQSVLINGLGITAIWDNFLMCIIFAGGIFIVAWLVFRFKNSFK